MKSLYGCKIWVLTETLVEKQDFLPYHTYDTIKCSCEELGTKF